MKIIHELIPPRGYFPGNPYYPLLIYKESLLCRDREPKTVQIHLLQNDWRHSWVGSIYDYHHYHSNTHELLAIISGNCEVQFGGENGSIYTVNQDDVIIIPAGVAHRSLHMSDNFQCIGAYPFEVEYDMRYGTAEEYPEALNSIKQVGLPKKDPVFGEEGALFTYLLTGMHPLSNT